MQVKKHPVGLVPQVRVMLSFSRETDKHSFPYSGQTSIDRPQQVYKMYPPKINIEADQSKRIHVT